MNGLELVALVVLASLGGATAAVLALSLSSRGERARFSVELTPVRGAITELGEQLDHLRKRQNTRASRQRDEDEDDDQNERKDRLAKLREARRGSA